jgi:cytoskeleton protein RodZ
MTESLNDGVMPLNPSSPGALMKAAREKAGIHLAILSVHLKVTVKQLEALEADQFDQLPEPVFARALAAKVCRMIQLDPQQVLPLMPVASNGLKPLNLIDPDGQASFAGQRSGREGRQILGSSKFWLLLAVIALLWMGLSNQWSVNLDIFNSAPKAAEVVPAMPPVQEPVAPEAAQNELPKAMVFESSSPNGAAPALASPETVSTEVKK